MKRKLFQLSKNTKDKMVLSLKLTLTKESNRFILTLNPTLPNWAINKNENSVYKLLLLLFIP